MVEVTEREGITRRTRDFFGGFNGVNGAMVSAGIGVAALDDWRDLIVRLRNVDTGELTVDDMTTSLEASIERESESDNTGERLGCGGTIGDRVVSSNYAVNFSAVTAN